MSFWFKRAEKVYNGIVKEYEGQPKEVTKKALTDERLGAAAFYGVVDVGTDILAGVAGVYYLGSTIANGELDHTAAHLWCGYMAGKMGKHVYNWALGKHPIWDHLKGKVTLRPEDEVAQTAGSFQSQSIAGIAAAAGIELIQGAGIISGTPHLADACITAAGANGGIVTSVDGIDDADYLAYHNAMLKVDPEYLPQHLKSAKV